MGSQGPGQLEDVVEDECRVAKSVDPVRVVPVKLSHNSHPLLKNLKWFC